MGTPMKLRSTQLLIILTLGGLSFLACGRSKDDDADKTTDSDSGSGGSTPASGGSSGSVLDRDALAARCDGMNAIAGEACGEAELVCADDAGILCICGGVPPETGQVQGTPTGNGNGGGGGPRPGSGGTTGSETTNSPENSDLGALSWECFSIGPVGLGGETGSGGEPGSGGEAMMGGQGGAQ
jgi:hypothetical protein